MQSMICCVKLFLIFSAKTLILQITKVLIIFKWVCYIYFGNLFACFDRSKLFEVL